MAIVALVLWMLTAGVGSYLLATATRERPAESAPAEPVSVPSPPPSSARRARPDRDPFAPPSLQRERAEQLPLLRSLAEFAHPALAIIGLGVWLGYVLTRDRLMLSIGLGVLIGAIAAGLSLFTANTRAARRAAQGQAPAIDPRFAPPSFAPRALMLHAIGAALTLLVAALLATHAV